MLTNETNAILLSDIESSLERYIDNNTNCSSIPINLLDICNSSVRKIKDVLTMNGYTIARKILDGKKYQSMQLKSDIHIHIHILTENAA